MLPALGIAAAGGVLAADPPAWAAALAVWGAVAAAWTLGPTGGRQFFTAAFFVSLASGTALAAGGAAPVVFGLPLSLWGLFVGVFLVPLALTTLGFALDFEPPDRRGLERLRKDR